MPTWEELLKNRKLIPSLKNSGDMLKCVEIVRGKYPNAHIEAVSEGALLWHVVADGKELSNAHSSHYACWDEARAIAEKVS